MATLREWGFGPVAKGDALAVRVAAGRDGPMVCEVRDWDHPTRPRGRRRDRREPDRAVELADSRSAPRHPGRDPRTDAAVLALLAEDARGGIGGWPRARAGLSGSDIAALVALRRHSRHVDTILTRMLGAE
jgi:hypothetical protein